MTFQNCSIKLIKTSIFFITLIILHHLIVDIWNILPSTHCALENSCWSVDIKELCCQYCVSPGRCVASRQYPPAASTRCTTSSTNNTRITLFIIWKAANFRHFIKTIYCCSTLPSPVQSNASDCKARAALDTYLHFPFKIIHELRCSVICALCALSRPCSL